MSRRISKLAVLALGASFALGVLGLNAAEWRPVPGHIMTRWAADVNPRRPLPEYPRPQMERRDWINLNGLWDYAIQPTNAAAPGNYDGQILVPYPIESALSGVKKPLTNAERLWYRRQFKSPKLESGKRLLLHFGAVDWEAKVCINGQSVGEHRGGYDPFSFDITDAVKPGENELVVAVYDATGNRQAIGKQNFNKIAKPGGIAYAPSSGIWQTVWLEVVPAKYIADLKIVPDVDAGVVRVTVHSALPRPRQGGEGRGEGAGSADHTGSARPLTLTLSPSEGERESTAGASLRSREHLVEVSAFAGGKKISSVTGAANSEIILPIKDARLWSPDDPFLYQLTVRLGSDEVRSYFGMRKISIGKDEQGVPRLLLNGKFVFQAGPLDQGFWPDGLYTAPTDDALRFDVAEMKRLGFNMVRKHVKVEPARWFYWCDKLGLLVWQDMPSGGGGGGANDKKDGTPSTPEAAQQFESELKALVQTHWNHPSIIMRVVFNEGWGQYDTPRLTQWVKELDPARLVSNASGWNDKECGDVRDVHSYPGPAAPKIETVRAGVLGEFGGLGLGIPEHAWVPTNTWGYRSATGKRHLTRNYVELWRKTWDLKRDAGLSAAVYTQLTDVETESNGLLTYDRKVVKVDAAQAAAAHRGQFAPPPVFTTVAPTAQNEPVRWRFTTNAPGENWMQPKFDDGAWLEGAAGFGSSTFTNRAVRTAWNEPEIWLRREVTLERKDLRGLAVKCLHESDVEIYVNGVLAVKTGGRKQDYEELDLKPAAQKALRRGTNLIAVRCKQSKNGSFIDVGLVQEQK